VAVSYGTYNQATYGQGPAPNWRATFTYYNWAASTNRMRVGFMTSDLNSNGVGTCLPSYYTPDTPPYTLDTRHTTLHTPDTPLYTLDTRHTTLHPPVSSPCF